MFTIKKYHKYHRHIGLYFYQRLIIPGGIFNMKNDLWNAFEKSGRIEDYLKYKGYPGCDSDADDNGQWGSNKRTSGGRQR